MKRQPPFLGTFVNKVDSKGRVSIPAPFRPILSAHGLEGAICFPSFRVAAIEGCTLDFMTDISESVADIELFSDRQEDLSTAIFARSHNLNWDSGGRIQLPATLMKHAAITNSATFIGMGKTFRIWEPTALERAQSARDHQAREQGLTLKLVRDGED